MKILLAVDGSQHALKAVDRLIGHACRLRKIAGMVLTTDCLIARKPAPAQAPGAMPGMDM